MGPAGAALVATAAVLLGCFLLLAALWLGQRRLVYFPGGAPPRIPGGVEAAMLTTTDGLRLRAWYLTPVSAPPASHAVLVANGNAGHRGDRLELARALADLGLAVLVFDYRGYGGNPGRPSERGLLRDAEAARRHLVEERGISPARLIYLGESLGTAVVAALAVRHPPAGLVLRSPFPRLSAVARAHYPFLPTWLIRDRFPVLEYLTGISAPTTVVLGAADEVVPPQHSRAVAQATEHLIELVEVPHARHNDRALSCGRALVGAVDRMVQAVAGNERPLD